MLLSLLEYGLNHLPSGGKMIFNDKKFEFQISLEKESVRHQGFSPNWIYWAEVPLGQPTCAEHQALSRHPSIVGVFPSCWCSGVLFRCSFINKHLPDFLQRWSLPCVTLQDTRDRARTWSPAVVHGVPLGASGSIVSCLHCLRHAWVHCRAEAL